jgi:hypothetical protein
MATEGRFFFIPRFRSDFMPQNPRPKAHDSYRLPPEPELELDLEAILIADDAPEPPASIQESGTVRTSLAANIAGQLLGCFAGCFTPLSGPYRVVAYKLNTFPNVGGGILTLIGIMVVYPVFLITFTFLEPTGPVEIMVAVITLAWLVMMVAAWVQGWARWCIEAPRRDQTVSQSWAGKLEPALVLATSVLGWVFGGSGFGLFVLSGYVASTLQIHLVRLQKRLEAWSAEDSERLLMPVRSAAASTGGKVRTAAVSAGAAAIPVIGAVKGALRRPKVEGASAAAPTFWGRVMSVVVGHTIFSFVFGSLSLGALFSVGGFLLAIPLWMLGWDLKPPEEDRQRGQEFFQGVNEAIQKERAGWEKPFREESHTNRPAWDSEEDGLSGFGQRGFQ